jgi:Na+/proline symporter
MISGLTLLDLAVILLYLAGITYIGLRAARSVKTTGDFFMGGRRFGKLLMIAKAFGVGTRADHVVAVTGASYQIGLAGVWYQWLYIFSTPFFWIIAPIYRRLRYVTTGDFFEERYGTAAGAAYSLAAILFFAVEIGMVLRGTGTTVEAITQGALSAEIIIVLTTLVFVGYGTAGGLVAAVSTKLLQSVMLMILSVLLLPFALAAVGGIGALREKLPAAMFSLFSSSTEITPFVVIMLTLNGLVGVVALPHHMAIGGAGKTEMSCRMGWTYGNIVKRFATLAWAFTGVLASALVPGLLGDSREQALGAMILQLLPQGLVGLMIAAMVASLMAVCDAYMVDGSALFTRNFYNRLVKKKAQAGKELRVARWSSVGIVMSGIAIAFLLPDVLSGLKIIWKMMAFFGIPFWMAIMWDRGNRYGLWASLAVTSAAALYTDSVLHWSLADQILLYLPAGLATFVAASLLTPPEPAEKLRTFSLLLHTPVGEEWRLAEAGVPVMLAGESVSAKAPRLDVPLEEQGHSLLLVDLLHLRSTFSWKRYRVDIQGFVLATLMIVAIIGAAALLARAVLLS